MLLELDDVAVGDGVGVGRAQDGSNAIVDGAGAEGWNDSSCSAGCEGESGDASHGDSGSGWR